MVLESGGGGLLLRGLLELLEGLEVESQLGRDEIALPTHADWGREV